MMGNPDVRSIGNSGWQPVGKSQCNPLKIGLLHGDLDPSNTCFLGPTQVTILNGITNHSAAFARLMVSSVMTDRLTDRPRYSISSDMPHLANGTIHRLEMLVFKMTMH